MSVRSTSSSDLLGGHSPGSSLTLGQLPPAQPQRLSGGPKVDPLQVSPARPLRVGEHPSLSGKEGRRSAHQGARP